MYCRKGDRGIQKIFEHIRLTYETNTEGNFIMNILIHIGSDKFPDEGPAAKRMKVFYEILKEQGHQVTVLAPAYRGEIKSIQGVYYCKLPELKDKRPMNRLMNQIGFGLTSFFKSFRTGKADIVITTSPPVLVSPFGWLIAKLKHAKLVYDVRDIWPDVAWEMESFDKTSLYSRIFEFVRNFMLRHADLITTVSNGKVKKLQGYRPKADVIYVTNGLDEHFLENEDRAELADKYHMDEKFTCVYVGNLGLAQGLMQLMHVAKKAKENGLDVQFLLFGSGVEENELKTYALENRLDHVFFPGKLPNADMYTILKRAKVSFVSLVNESLKDSVPTKMFEALGVGCPVLLAAVGDAADILRECNLGETVKPNDEESLWEAFYRLYKNMPDVLRNRENAKEIVYMKYSRQRAAVKFERELSMRFQKK